MDRIQDKEKNSRSRKDVLLDSNMFEIALIVRNDRESNFVQFCNLVNGRRNAPKIISANVNTSIFNGIGRITTSSPDGTDASSICRKRISETWLIPPNYGWIRKIREAIW